MYSPGILCGRQSKNFIAQGNLFPYWVHDNKRFESWIFESWILNLNHSTLMFTALMLGLREQGRITSSPDTMKRGATGPTTANWSVWDRKQVWTLHSERFWKWFHHVILFPKKQITQIKITDHCKYSDIISCYYLQFYTYTNMVAFQSEDVYIYTRCMYITVLSGSGIWLAKGLSQACDILLISSQ